MNPFEDDFDEFEPCPGIAQCRYQDHDFRRFTNTPAPLSLDRVRGGVVLIAGPPGHGKTVFGHRLLHEYQTQGLELVELLPEGPSLNCPARRARVLEKLRDSMNALASADGGSTKRGDDMWAADLRTTMRNGGEGRVVRLPCIMPNTADPDDRIAWEICQYAMAAQMSKSVFIYEYNAVQWPDGWEKTRRDIESNRDTKVRTNVLDPVAPDELWAYVKGVIDGSPHKEITLDPAAPKLLKFLFDRDRPHPGTVRRLMRRVYEIAIAEQSAKVTLDHLLSVAMRMEGEPA